MAHRFVLDRSYAEVARWVRGDRDDPAAPLCAVLTTVDDFEAQVLVGKNDVELIPKRLRMKGTAEHDLLASQAEWTYPHSVVPALPVLQLPLVS